METKIAFDRIRALIADETSNRLAFRMAEGMDFSGNYEIVCRRLRQTEEFRQILLMENSFPMQDFFDMSDELARIAVDGTVIDAEAMADFKASLRTIDGCLHFLMDGDEIKYTELHHLASRVELAPSLFGRIDKIVDDKGEIRDDASPELLDIRRRMERKRVEMDAQIGRSLSKAKREGWAPEGAEATIRNGRLVIPMIDTHRRKMKGIIQDESASRQTAFVEPAEVVELGNDLRELEFAERKEVQRILEQLTAYLRPMLPQLEGAYLFLAQMDFLRAKARFAISVGAEMPIVNDRPMIQWLDARHPLLHLSFQRQNSQSGGVGKEVVPFNIDLDEGRRILVVSGPNAGGKSVCLKAVGLIQYMLQCGLLVPCRPTSEFGIFQSIFIDIGDQQSIDNDLSTYSSHLQNMKRLLAEANGGTLFLLDELGGGTEPRSGCAIAEALLEELYRRDSFGVVTTHFADLKLLADRYEGILNGAMLFDTERMMPLYKLAIGHPGSSFAFEIAARIGFPLDVLEAAESKVGTEMLNFEHQLQQLEIEKEELAKHKAQLQVQDDFLNEVVQKYQTLTEKLESRRHDIVDEARKQARQIIDNANAAVERTIAEIKKSNAEREHTKMVREELKAESQRLETEMKEAAVKAQKTAKDKAQPKQQSAKEEDYEILEGPVQVGDIVRIDDGDSYGQLVELKGSKAVVESGSVRMTIALKRLTRTRKKSIPVDKTHRTNVHFQSIYDDINEKRKNFSITLDLRGHRADEAVDELRHFIDEAQLLSERELRVLHGKGYGILKTVVRQELQRMNEVESFGSAPLNSGGDGVTIVHLK